MTIVRIYLIFLNEIELLRNLVIHKKMSLKRRFCAQVVKLNRSVNI